MNNSNRVLHITLRKCGSQWVRDVLSAPEIVRFSGLPYSGVTLVQSLKEHGSLSIKDNTFSGPIYGMNAWEWQYWKKPSDKALVVLRDPRDLVVSQMFSLLFSHASTEAIDFGRYLLHSMTDDTERLQYMIYETGKGNDEKFFLTWLHTQIPDVLQVRYEDLVASEFSCFRNIVDWLKWPVPEDVLANVVKRLSFEHRSGRKPGLEDKFSHYRRGVSGDWRNYFTKALGKWWEYLHPGFLTTIGYETADNWWEYLPDSLSGDNDSVPQESMAYQGKVPASYVSVVERNLKLSSQQLVEKEHVIQELSLAAQALQQQLLEKEAVIQSFVARTTISLT